jgi:hypothetical protein
MSSVPRPRGRPNRNSSGKCPPDSPLRGSVFFVRLPPAATCHGAGCNFGTPQACDLRMAERWYSIPITNSNRFSAGPNLRSTESANLQCLLSLPAGKRCSFPATARASTHRMACLAKRPSATQGRPVDPYCWGG